jgi:ATP-binding cassette subfamily B protein
MRVLRFILKAIQPFRTYIFGICFAVFIIALDANIKPYLVKCLIDAITKVESYNLLTLILLYAGSQLSVLVAWSLSDYCITSSIPRFRCHMMSLFVERLNRYSYGFFQDHLSGTLTAKINDVFNHTYFLVVTIIHKFIHFLFVVSFSFFLFKTVHFGFILITLGCVTVSLLITVGCIKRNKELIHDYAESKSQILGHLADYLINFLAVRCFVTKAYEQAKLNRVSKGFIQSSYKQGYFSMKFFIAQNLIFTFYIVSCLLLLIYQYKQEVLTAGELVLVFTLNFKIVEQLDGIANILRDFVTNWGTVDQALKILEIPIEVPEGSNAVALVVSKGEIIFDQVQFHYRDAEALFNNKSITIKAGQKVGLVGYSGSGKSTFANLILRLFDVDAGRILIDGQSIKDVTQDSLHAAIGTIPQDPSLFHRTLFENIRYGRLNASEEAVIDASKKAYAHEFIEKLPQGYNTLVGERGIKLSGGQRQRIAIARVILKNAPILILDEATSQLDSLTESHIQSSLWELMQNKTTLVVAHRLSTLLQMDRILVFDSGKITQDGTHKDLLAQDGLYKNLWHAQIGGFLPETL